MKIKKLIVKNYKVFDHLDLDFTDKNGDVLDTIVFAGLNGSGKTTILELLADLLNGYDPLYFTDGTFISIEFLLSKKQAQTEFINRLSDVNFTFDKNTNVLRFSQSKFFSELNPPFKQFKKLGILIEQLKEPKSFEAIHFLSIDRTLNKMEVKSLGELEPIPNHKSNYWAEFNVFTTTLIEHHNTIRQRLLQLIKKEVFANPDIAPRQIFTKQLTKINEIFRGLKVDSKLVEVSEKDLIFQSINGKKIGFDDLSSGEKMLYFMGFTLNQLNPNESLIMVDQPEDSLHPVWQQQIVKFYQNIGENNQIMLATHSPQIIASVKPESLFVLGINEDTHRIEAVNMAAEHKHTRGVDPNRILAEIMGTPIRDYETQQKINAANEVFKYAQTDPSVKNLEKADNLIAELTDALGKQDAVIMRLNNEMRLLKRKMEVVA